MVRCIQGEKEQSQNKATHMYYRKLTSNHPLVLLAAPKPGTEASAGGAHIPKAETHSSIRVPLSRERQVRARGKQKWYFEKCGVHLPPRSWLGQSVVTATVVWSYITERPASCPSSPHRHTLLLLFICLNEMATCLLSCQSCLHAVAPGRHKSVLLSCIWEVRH